jgi:sortase B
MRNAAKALTVICIIAAVSAALALGKYLMDAGREEKSFSDLSPDLPEQSTEFPAPGPDAPGDPYISRWKKLYAKNPDFVACLKVPGTKVDYPVLQRKGSPEYYLPRDFKGKNSTAGTPFLAGVCDIEKPSDNLILYGHHMRSGAMFATLTRFTDKAFYEKHSEILLLTEGGLKKYEVVCAFKTQVGAGGGPEFRYYEKADFSDEADLGSFMKSAKDRQYYETGVTAVYMDKLITLSTCEYTSRNGRLVVLGVLVT